MAYQPFILKYRPRTFQDVVGQEHVSRTLRHALATGRIVHAYLFCGPRGTGKTTMARILARALNCVHGPTPNPCGVCEPCVAILEGRSMDVLEMDAATHRGIDDVRELRESVKYAPSQGRYKVYILDECHMLTTEANNALLKTLEEPPSHAYFVLLTTEPYRLLPTLLSRCQRFDFRPLTVPDIITMLRRIAEAEGLEVEEEALAAIAYAAEGGMRDAESIFERVVSFSEGKVTLELTNQVLGITEAATLVEIAEIVARHDIPAVFALVDRLVREGKNIGRLVEDLTALFRDMLRLALGSRAGVSWLQFDEESQHRLQQVAQAIGSERLLAAVQALAELSVKLKESAQHAILLELTLTQLAQPTIATPMARPAASSVAAAKREGTTAAAETATTPPRASAGAPARRAPASIEGPLSIALVREHWPNVLLLLRVNLRAFMKPGTPVALREGRVVVSFPDNCQFHAKQAERYATAIEEALERYFRQPLKLEVRIGAVAEAAAAEACESVAMGEGEAVVTCAAEEAPPDTSASQRPTATDEESLSEEAAAMATAELQEAPSATPQKAEAEESALMPGTTETAPTEAGDFSLSSETTAQPAKRMTAEEAVAQTLRLFPGSEEQTPSL